MFQKTNHQQIINIGAQTRLFFSPQICGFKPKEIIGSHRKFKQHVPLFCRYLSLTVKTVPVGSLSHRKFQCPGSDKPKRETLVYINSSFCYLRTTGFQSIVQMANKKSFLHTRKATDTFQNYDYTYQVIIETLFQHSPPKNPTMQPPIYYWTSWQLGIMV